MQTMFTPVLINHSVIHAMTV